ncbi:MAG: ABC transporter substrate-binding protein [Anaerolineaceae bacterium]|nr:ABC transporter substrate-binding protein [Anaerolineaceae bacterium]
MRFHRIVVLLLLLAVLSGLAGCAAGSYPQLTATPKQATLKITVLPILEALPVLVAQQEGYFSAHGVNVEIVTAASAPERDQLIASGQVDGMINELLGALLYNKDTAQVQVVRYARSATKDTALFRILASRQSQITNSDGLKNTPIGISNGTVIEYLTDRLLEAEGFQPDEIKGIAVPKLGDRLALLNSGELKAGMFPEPQAELAIQQGAVLVLDDTRHPEYSFSVITLRSATIEKNPEAVRGFLAGWEEAVKQINADPNRWKSLLVARKILSAPLEASFQVPQFVQAGAPSQTQYQDMLDWAKAKNLSVTGLGYAKIVNASFLPK